MDVPPLAGRRVLVHVHERIWPTDCGFHLRCWQVLDGLRTLGAQVQVVAADGPRPPRGQWTSKARTHFEAAGIPLHLVPFHAGTPDFWLAALWHAWHKRLRGRASVSPSSRFYWRPGLERRWRELLRTERPAATLVNYANWHRLAAASRQAGVRSFMEMHESLAAHFVVREELQSGWRPAAAVADQLFAEELQCLDAADCVLAINAEEGARVRPRLRARVIDLPFCLPDLAPSALVEPEVDVLVVGSFIEHNKRGLRQFLEGAWPQIRAARPNARLRVCGRVGEDMAPDPSIEYHAFVPDLAPYYHRTRLVLITTVAGAGIKIKTIEALAHGCCIVAHAHSVTGTPFQTGVHGETTEDLGRVAPTVLRLLSDPALRERYRAAAHQLYRERFSLAHSRAVLAQAFGGTA